MIGRGGSCNSDPWPQHLLTGKVKHITHCSVANLQEGARAAQREGGVLEEQAHVHAAHHLLPRQRRVLQPPALRQAPVPPAACLQASSSKYESAGGSQAATVLWNSSRSWQACGNIERAWRCCSAAGLTATVTAQTVPPVPPELARPGGPAPRPARRPCRRTTGARASRWGYAAPPPPPPLPPS